MPVLLGDRYLQIVGETVTVSLNRPNYYLRSIAPLLGSGTIRGRDRVLPGTSGVIENPRRRTLTHHALRLVIDGEVDDDDNPTANPAVACEDTLEFLIAELCDDTGGKVSPFRSATLQPSGRTAQLRVVEIGPVEDQQGATLIECSFVVEVQDGRFE